MELDEAVRLIVNADAETSELTLKEWLDHLYREVPQHGLSSLQLQQMINFICESPALSVSTKLYIVENFLLPNDYVGLEVMQEIMRHLGTANAISPYKLEVPLTIQNGLCKWIVNIFFLLLPIVDKRVMAIHDSVWIHLWQYDNLQKWLTYVIVWSTSSAKDIRPWKIELLRRVGLKTGYTDAQACATLILKRYETILGRSGLVSEAILTLNCNARKLRTLQEIKLDSVFLGKLRKLLTNNSNFTNELIDELIASQLAALQFYKQADKNIRYYPKLPKDKIPLLEIRSIDQLAWNWDKIVASKDVEQILDPHAGFTPLLFLFHLLERDQLWDLLYEWISIHLAKCLKEKEQARNQKVLRTITKVCQVHPHLTTKLFSEFLTYDNLKTNPTVFTYFFKNLLPLLLLRNSTVRELHKSLLQIFASCHLDNANRKEESIIPDMCSSLLLLINSWFQDDVPDFVLLGLDFLQDLQKVLISKLHHNLENRFVTTSVMLLLKTLPNAKYQEEFHMKRLMFSAGCMNKLIIYDDALLLDSCCQFLIQTKGFLTNKESSNRYVQSQNFHIMDLTNYLWRNKILHSKKFLNIPTNFVNEVLDNLFIPNTKNNQKFTFSVAGIASLSYVVSVKLKELESKFETKIQYTYLINDEGFKQFLADNKDLEGQWLPNVHSSADLRIIILREMYISGPFKHIALFLFTYLKSLSQYIHE